MLLVAAALAGVLLVAPAFAGMLGVRASIVMVAIVVIASKTTVAS